MRGKNRVLGRSLFEIENARNLSRDDVVGTFVPTQAFWRLLSSKNHVVLGSRGSGKTVLAKMLSHDHLAHLRDERTQSVIQRRAFVGVYLPTSVEWVGALRNKRWRSEQEGEEEFAWQLNVSSCLAALVTLRSCLDVYVRDRGERANVEARMAQDLSEAWSDGEWKADTLRSLQRCLEDLSYRRQQQLARRLVYGRDATPERAVGSAFSTAVFAPLKRAILVAQRALSFPEDAVWALCLDEAEVLELHHHRVLNSYLRSASLPLVFKITTMPYCHYTLDTNIGVPLNVGHDFEYVYIDQDPVVIGGKGDGATFADALFQRRAKRSGSRYRAVTLGGLLGESQLLDPRPETWGPDSGNMELLRQYASPETVARGEALLPRPMEFRDQIARKLHGALLLRDAVAQLRGRGELEVYSGARMAIRCGDANPRRLIRIFNAFLLGAKWDGGRAIPLSRRTQTRILLAFSQSTLARVQSEPHVGLELFKLLDRIGSYMRADLHERPLTTDQVSSVRVDRDVEDDYWKLMKHAVTLGLLFPNVGANNPDQMPDREGTFHLAYVLAPMYRLLPRRGRAHALRTILKATESVRFVTESNQSELSLEDPEV